MCLIKLKRKQAWRICWKFIYWKFDDKFS